MHEVSIAHALLLRASEAAAREGLSTVQRVGVCIGRYSGVYPDALEFAFEILREGPVLGGAALEVRTGEAQELNLEWIEGDP
jgi:hydrogenase nickel incorporation protein HypA/HybF